MKNFRNLLAVAKEDLIDQAEQTQGAEVSTSPEAVNSAVDFQAEIDAIEKLDNPEGQVDDAGAGDGMGEEIPGEQNPGDDGAGDTGGDDVGGTDGAVSEEPQSEPDNEEQEQTEQEPGGEQTQDEDLSGQSEEAQEFAQAVERAAAILERVYQAHERGVITPAHEALVDLELRAIGNGVGVSLPAAIAAESNAPTQSSGAVKRAGEKVMNFIKEVLKKLMEWGKRFIASVREFVKSYRYSSAKLQKDGFLAGSESLLKEYEGNPTAAAAMLNHTFKVPMMGPGEFNGEEFVAHFNKAALVIKTLATHAPVLDVAGTTFGTALTVIKDNLTQQKPFEQVMMLVGNLLRNDAFKVDELRHQIARLDPEAISNNNRQALQVSLAGGGTYTISPLQVSAHDPMDVINAMNGMQISLSSGGAAATVTGLTIEMINGLDKEGADLVVKSDVIVRTMTKLADFCDQTLVPTTAALLNGIRSPQAATMYPPAEINLLVRLVLAFSQDQPQKIVSMLGAASRLMSSYATSLASLRSQFLAQAQKEMDGTANKQNQTTP